MAPLIIYNGLFTLNLYTDLLVKMLGQSSGKVVGKWCWVLKMH